MIMSNSGKLPSEFELVRTETKGVTKKSTYNKDLQVSKDTLNEIKGVSEGDFLKITNNVGEVEMSTYGRVEPRTDNTHYKEMGNNEVALGVTGRDGICARADEDTVEVSHVGFRSVSRPRAVLNRLMGVRPVVCRVRKAISTDAGYRVCRLREDVKQTIGIDWGDHIVLQSPEGRVGGIKALPITEHQREIVQDRQNTDSYRSPIEETEINDHVDLSSENLPRIHIAQATRQGLNINDKRYSGVHQPIKIHRDTRYVGLRILHSLTIPFLFTLIAALVGLDLSPQVAIILIGVGFAVLVLSTYLESRQALR